MPHATYIHKPSRKGEINGEVSEHEQWKQDTHKTHTHTCQ